MSLRRLRRDLRVPSTRKSWSVVRWRGGSLDHLLDARHAASRREHESAGSLQPGWTVQPEVSYSVFGERGSIDLLAWHASSRTLLVIEVKTELTSVEETLRRHDAKVRLARAGRAGAFRLAAARLRARLLVHCRTTRTRATPVERQDRASRGLSGAWPGTQAWLRRPSERVARWPASCSCHIRMVRVLGAAQSVADGFATLERASRQREQVQVCRSSPPRPADTTRSVRICHPAAPISRPTTQEVRSRPEEQACGPLDRDAPDRRH